MDSKKSKLLTIITAVIGLIGILFLIRVIMAGDDVKESAEVQAAVVDPFISFSYILLIITAAITVVLSIINLVKHPKALKKTLLGVVILGVLLAITYFTASGEAVIGATGRVIENGEAGATSKWVSALINFTGILGLLGLLAIGQGFVKSMIK
ncbi:MAG TPA: hypothetical protein ENK46_13550 [Flavobacteriia bacterium]|nr:hypothetical protein [Flavobacteriia bacterium]